MVCPYCGSTISDTTDVCPYCGESVAEKSTAADKPATRSQSPGGGTSAADNGSKASGRGGEVPHWLILILFGLMWAVMQHSCMPNRQPLSPPEIHVDVPKV